MKERGGSWEGQGDVCRAELGIGGASGGKGYWRVEYRRGDEQLEAD